MAAARDKRANSSTLDSISFGSFWAKHGGLKNELVIDLRSVELITPSALVQLAAVLHSINDEGRRPTLLLEGSPVRSYLERTRFVETIDSFANTDLRSSLLLSHLSGGSRGSNPMLIEVTKIDGGATLPRVLNQIVATLREKLKYRKDDAFDIATVVSEVCQNTFDHNQATFGFLAMQGYGTGKKRFLEIGISDHGAGLRETLRRNPKHHGIKSDLAAIQHAILAGTSEHDDPTRGTGLHHLMEITYRHGGTVQIWSGGTKVRFRMDRKAGWSFPVPLMRGVHVALILPTKRA